MAKSRRSGAVKPPISSKNTTNTTKKSTNNISTNNKSELSAVERMYACTWSCHWACVGEHECIAVEKDGDQCRSTLVECAHKDCGELVHPECHANAVHFITQGKVKLDKDSEAFCSKHCNFYQRLNEMMKQNKTGGITMSVYSASEEEDGRKKKEVLSLGSSSDSSDIDSDDDEDKKPSAYDGHKKKEVLSLGSSSDSSDIDSDDDDRYDDDEDANNNGLGAAKAKSTTKKNGGKQPNKKNSGKPDPFDAFFQALPYEEGYCSSDKSGSDDDGDTPAAGGLGGLIETAEGRTATFRPSIEDVAAAFARKNFKVNGTVVNAKDKHAIVAKLVCEFQYPGDGCPISESCAIFEGYLDEAWHEYAYNVWVQLYEMLDGTGKKIKQGTNVSGSFSVLTCKLGRIFHSDKCKDDNCDLCDPDLPPRISARGMGQQRKNVKKVVACFEQAAADLKRTKSEATSKEAKRQKKDKAKLKDKHVANFRYQSRLVVPEKCPKCGHQYLQKLFSDNEMKERNNEVDREYQARMTLFKEKPISQQNKAKQPRRRAPSQQLKCACLYIKGAKNCPLCKGKNMKKCEICNCKCSLGPFERKDLESIARIAQSEKMGYEVNTARDSVVEKAHTLVGLLTNSCQNARRDLEANNITVTSDTIAGAGAAYLANADITDDFRQYAAEQIGHPTARLSEDIHINDLQKGGRNYRFYNNRLGRTSTESSATIAPPVARARDANSGTTPPPTTLHVHSTTRSSMSSRSSTSTFAERSGVYGNRVYRHFDTGAKDLQSKLDFTPKTFKRRKKKARKKLADNNNNEIKMMATSEASISTPELGSSQSTAIRIMQNSDLENSDDDSDRERKKKKSHHKKKKEDF